MSNSPISCFLSCVDTSCLSYVYKNATYIYIYIYIYMCVCANIKKDLQWKILFILELFAKVKCFGFYIKPSSDHLDISCCIFRNMFNCSCCKMIRKNEKVFFNVNHVQFQNCNVISFRKFIFKIQCICLIYIYIYIMFGTNFSLPLL